LLRSLAKLGDLLATLAIALARLMKALQELAESLARRFSRDGDGPTLPTKPMPDQFRYETDPNHPSNPFPGQSVRRLTPEELERHRVFVGEDGRIYQSDGTPFDTRGSNTAWGGQNSDRAIFVMDEHGNICASKYQEVGVFHHSTLSNGGPVAGAGELRVENGTLVGITDQSGHYLPERSMTQRVMETLEGQGVDMGGVQPHLIAPEGT
jgi:hypothetical protein